MAKKSEEQEQEAVEQKDPKNTAVKKKSSAVKKKDEKDEKKSLLDEFGEVRKNFILDNIRVIDYVDLANLVGVKAPDLKKAVEEMGIKLPIDRAMKWNDLDVGTFKSLKICARCQVHLNHDAFMVGIENCRKCLEKNIKLWLDKKMPIRLTINRF